MRKLILIVGVLIALDHLVLDGELLLKQLRQLTS
jgi:hypothetical protein